MNKDAILGLEDAPLAEVVTQAEVEKAAESKIDAVKNRLLEQAAEIVSGALSWPELEKGQEGPPQEWVERLGPKKAMAAYRCALAGTMPSSDAPVAVKMASQILIGILKSHADRDKVPQLHIQMVQLSQGGGREYPSIKVESE